LCEERTSLDLNVARTNRILVRGVNWVGDTILAYPAVEGLKNLFPKSHLAVLVPNHLVDLWRTFPAVDEVIPFGMKRGQASFREDVSLAFSLRKKGFDLSVILPRSFRSAFQVYLAGIPVRIGYEDEGRSFLLSHGIPRTAEVFQNHRVHYYRKLLEPLGKAGTFSSPRIFLREEERRWAREKLEGMGISDGKLMIGMNPGATYGLAKCWYPERFGELGRRLSRKWNAPVLLFGKEEEKPMAEGVLRHLGEAGVNLMGKTSLLQLAALLERCRILVTNDTGTMHVATAAGTRVIALFGSTDPVTTGPWGDGHVVVRKEVACSPCLKRVCPTDHRCMDLITVDEVEEIVNRKLEGREE
jgi:heptosyltransferase II